jgi:hypothetical protein
MRIREFVNFVKFVFSPLELTQAGYEAEAAAALQNSIELVQKFERGEYEVLNDTLHHYRFELSAGVVERIGIAGVVSLIDELKRRGVYRKAATAKIYKFPVQ